MIYLEIAILFGCIIYAAKLGGVGVGMAGGLGMAIAVFGLGLKPGEIPVDVILIILTVIFAISCMQLAGGMDYMVKISARLLRGNPKYINFLAPAITFLLTVLGGTGFTAMSVLNVIQEVAKENGVRPSQPLTSAVIASQIAITASPISAATAAMYVVVEKMGVSFGQALAVIVPAAIAGSIVAVIISSYQGVDLEKDPIFQKRLKEGLVVLKSKQKEEQPTTAKAKLSVGIFLLAVLFIVGMLLFKTQIGHTLGSRDIIIIAMLMSGLVTYWVCRFPLSGIKDTPVFGGGMESLIVVLGIVWMSSTIIGAHIPEIKTSATHLLEQYPALLAVAFFCVSALLFSQGATSALLVPVAASLGVDAATILASFVACSALFITTVYPTTAFAIACDDTGSYMDRKWNGSFVINHPFFIPGILGLVAAVPVGFLFAKIVL
ncbi:anaerobic C4-dicarboxylate transporter [uncultured Turicimonas sp.]|jgi:anaerobic C4-dicarboxylate transporter DcuA|uniref:anaerobic C4-dicarboxylate transporter n=1 Tax=uncultured Turicimonas sp. TaxID=1918607 RepID=UPI0028040E9A|nr:anaerobic C4-dicarboxylate transporter [uncultured Turicimonas sp.]